MTGSGPLSLNLPGTLGKKVPKVVNVWVVEFELTLGNKAPGIVRVITVESELSLREKMPTRGCQGLDHDVKTYHGGNGARECQGLNLGV